MPLSLQGQAQIYRQLSALANAGVSPGESLTALASQSQSIPMRQKLSQAAEAAWQGKSIVDSLRTTKMIPEYHCDVLTVGETTGRMDIVYKWLAGSAERDWNLQHKLKRELWHSKLTMTGAMLLIFIVIPIHGRWDATAIAALFALLAFAAVLGAEIVAMRLNGQSSVTLDQLILKLPWLGTIARDIAHARFARCFAALSAAGVETSQALRSAAKASGSVVLHQQVMRTIPAIERGAGIAPSLAATEAFAPFVLTMLGTGEFSGSIDTLMETVANFYDDDAAHRMHQFCVALGVFALLAVGTLVGLIAVRFHTGR